MKISNPKFMIYQVECEFCYYAKSKDLFYVDDEDGWTVIACMECIKRKGWK